MQLDQATLQTMKAHVNETIELYQREIPAKKADKNLQRIFNYVEFREFIFAMEMKLLAYQEMFEYLESLEKQSSKE